MNSFLGVGVSLDFEFNQYGELKKSEYEKSIEDSIYIIYKSW